MSKSEYLTINISLRSVIYFIEKRLDNLMVLYYTEKANSVKDYALEDGFKTFFIWEGYTIKMLNIIFQNIDLIYPNKETLYNLKANNERNCKYDSYFQTLNKYESFLRDLLSKLKIGCNIKMHEDSQRILEKNLEEILELEEERLKPKKIFIIYGNFENNKADIYEMENKLNKRFGLESILLAPENEVAMGAKTLIEIFEEHACQCHYAIAFITPDDLIEDYYQPRPNVIFEVGWFLKHLGRDKILLLEKKGKPIKWFSNLSGVHVLKYEQISNCFFQIESELLNADIILKNN